MHEGYWSTNLELNGWPAAGEDLIVARNNELAELTGTHIHCQHISSGKSVELIRQAKARGVPISGRPVATTSLLLMPRLAAVNISGLKTAANYKPKPGTEWPAYIVLK